MKDLRVAQRKQSASQEQRIQKAVAEQDTKQAQQWWEEEEQRAAMLRAIREHRELTVPLHWRDAGFWDASPLMQTSYQIREKRKSREHEQRSSRLRTNWKPRRRPTGYLQRGNNQRLGRSKTTEENYKSSTPH